MIDGTVAEGGSSRRTLITMTNNVQMLDNIPAHIFDDPNRASFLTLSLSSSARQLTLDRFVPVPPQPGGLYTHRTTSTRRRSGHTRLDLMPGCSRLCSRPFMSSVIRARCDCSAWMRGPSASRPAPPGCGVGPGCMPFGPVCRPFGPGCRPFGPFGQGCRPFGPGCRPFGPFGQGCKPFEQGWRPFGPGCSGVWPGGSVTWPGWAGHGCCRWCPGCDGDGCWGWCPGCDGDGCWE